MKFVSLDKLQSSIFGHFCFTNINGYFQLVYKFTIDDYYRNLTCINIILTRKLYLDTFNTFLKWVLKVACVVTVLL